MSAEQLNEILEQVKLEQHTSPFQDDEELLGYIKEGIFDINTIVGAEINYSEDLQARTLLKNYVLYANFKKTAEFKEVYGGEYAFLQAKYYKSASV